MRYTILVGINLNALKTPILIKISSYTKQYTICGVLNYIVWIFIPTSKINDQYYDNIYHN